MCKNYPPTFGDYGDQNRYCCENNFVVQNKSIKFRKKNIENNTRNRLLVSRSGARCSKTIAILNLTGYTEKITF